MRKFKMLLCALAVSTVSAWAQTTEMCVVVEQTNGGTANYLLSTEPRITFVNDVVTLTSTKETVELPAADVAKVYLSSVNTSTGIQQVEAPEAVLISLTDGKLALNGLKAGSPVTLYSADGRQLFAGTTSAAGALSLPLGQFPGGIIIVKTTSQTFKFIKK